MTITSAIVLLSVYWFIILFIILPINVTTQNDERNIIEGTAPSSPVNPNLKRKFSITTIVSIILWIPTCLVINLLY
jgi:predicted secreted protein